MEKESLIARLVNKFRGQLSPEDGSRLDDQLRDAGHAGDSRDFEAVWKLSGRYKASYRPDRELALQRFKANLAHGKRHRARRLIMLRSLAAALALLLVVAIWQWSKPDPDAPESIVFVEAGQTIRSIELHDGSLVTLNKGSSLEYAEKDGQMNGPLLLRGEGFFKVKPRAKGQFVIRTADTEVSVLGTSFNVRAFPEEDLTEVEVEEGRVSFSPRNGSDEPVIIEANEKAVYKAGKMLLLEAEPTLISRAWREPTLSFRKTPMREVVLALRRYYQVELDIADPAVGQCLFTSAAFRPEEMEQLLRNLEITFSSELQAEGKGHYLLKGGSCSTVQ